MEYAPFPRRLRSPAGDLSTAEYLDALRHLNEGKVDDALALLNAAAQRFGQSPSIKTRAHGNANRDIAHVLAGRRYRLCEQLCEQMRMLGED